MQRVVYHTARTVSELQVGQCVETSTRTIDQSDINTFAGLTGDWNEAHVSVPVAESSPAGAIVASAMLVASVGIGLFAATRWLSVVIGIFVGIAEWRAEKPVFAGDTIRCRATLVGLRPTSSGQSYVTEFRMEILAQRGKDRADADIEVRAMEFTVKFLCRDQEFMTMPTTAVEGASA